MALINDWQSVCVLGLGRSGAGAARLLRQRGVGVEIFDASPDSSALRIREMEDLGCKVFAGARGVSGTEFDAAIVSPGVGPDSSLLQSVQQRGIYCLSELEFAWACLGQSVIAITGSNGKSTLTRLCVDLFNACGQRAVACGNYGMPLSELMMSGETYDRIVVEVSSFQLETCDHFRPHIAILLNLNPNHLDRHGTMGAYRALKRRMFANMTTEDVAIVPYTEVRDLPGQASQITFGVADSDITITSDSVSFNEDPAGVISTEGTRFAGEDLGETVACVMALCRACDLDLEMAGKVLESFEPLPHRLEQVGVVEGVRFVNDSKATNLASMQAALRAVPGPVRLIAGGILKENDLSDVKELLVNKVAGVYLIGQSMLSFRDAWNDVVKCHECGTLESAMSAAWEDASVGESIVLSPACASFDQFQGFEHRGETFRTLVQSLRRER